MSAIRGLQLAKSFGQFTVFHDVSFEIDAGQCYALFGPNGAGKTTLLRILATLARPSMGTFEILGHDGVKDKDSVRANMFLLAHGPYLYDELSAIENLKFALALRGLSPSDRDLKIALDHVALGPFGTVKTRYYSAGMKRRLGLAKAILVRPHVLLMDEPYASLDEPGIGMMNRFIKERLKDGAAVLMTTHDRLRSAEVTHQAGVLNQGRLQALTLDQLKTDALF